MNLLRAVAFSTALATLPSLAMAASPSVGEVWHRSVQVSTQVQANGLYDTTQTWNVKVDSNAAARSAAEQTFGFSGQLEQVTVTEAYTLKPDGTKIPVSPSAILHEAMSATEDYPSFSDWQARTIIFPDVRPGDTVHYVLHRHAKVALFPGQFEHSLSVGPVGNVTRADISITLPLGEALNVTTSHMAEDAPVTQDGRITRSWHLDTSDSSSGGSVWLDVSTFHDYAALGDAYAVRAQPQAAPTPAIRALAARLTKGVTDPREKAERLYDYVAQNIRYVALQIGQGRVVPHDAETVMQLGYGDCKDHVTLLESLFSAVGIPSEPALISVKRRYDLPSTPTLAVLDHVILYVPQFDLYLDSTSPYAQFGVLPFGDYGKPVVLAEPTGSHVAHVPPLAPGVARAQVTTVAQIDPDGTVSGDTTTTASGPSAIALREVASGIETRGLSDAAEDQLRRLGTPGEGGFAFATPYALGGSYVLHGHFRLEDKLGEEEDNRFALPAGLTVLARSGGFLISSSTLYDGGHICYAGQQTENVTLHLPPGAGVDSMPRDVDVTGGFAHYTAHYALHDGTITAHRTFTVTAPRPVCTAQEYQAMRPVLTALRGDERAEISLVPGSGGSGASHGMIGASRKNAPSGPALAGGAVIGRKD